MPDVIAANIINFPSIALEEFHTSFHIYEDSHREYKLTDALEIHFIDMPRFRRLVKKDMVDPLHRWLMFLDQETKPEVLEEVLRMDKGIQKAQARMDFVSMDRESYRQYELREAQMAFYDQDVQADAKKVAEKLVEKAVREAVERAARETARKRNLEIARNLKARGISIEDIAGSTNLTSQEIEGL